MILMNGPKFMPKLLLFDFCKLNEIKGCTSNFLYLLVFVFVPSLVEWQCDWMGTCWYWHHFTETYSFQSTQKGDKIWLEIHYISTGVFSSIVCGPLSVVVVGQYCYIDGIQYSGATVAFFRPHPPFPMFLWRFTWGLGCFNVSAIPKIFDHGGLWRNRSIHRSFIRKLLLGKISQFDLYLQ